jgi:hypothetical protein
MKSHKKYRNEKLMNKMLQKIFFNNRKCIKTITEGKTAVKHATFANNGFIKKLCKIHKQNVN